MNTKKKVGNTILVVIMTILSLLWIYPVFMILINSLKKESAISTGSVFKLPTAETFAGLENYINAIESKGFLNSLGYSLFITITSVAAILLFCSMCAWYITRVKGILSKVLYFLFVFSMVVPFQMVMFTLSQTADKLHLNTPWNIWVIYLGFGAGLAVFMFCGFVKSIPLEVEEAALIDGCNPIQTFFKIDMHMLAPTMISVGILEAMWVWNDYLLPFLVLETSDFKTITLEIYYVKMTAGQYVSPWETLFPSVLIAILPLIVIFLLFQKHFVKGVTAGAVKS